MLTNRILLLAVLSSMLFSWSCQEKEYRAVIETELGNMTVKLYNTTPKHRDNFVKLVKEGYYDGLLFHRVISGFMIQGGDPDSRDAPEGQMLGQGGPGYTIDAEIGELHFKGALAAARQGDQVNPDRKSSGSQFYIVQGIKMNDSQLSQIEQQTSTEYTDEQKKIYREIGGYPPLDGQYTVFGEVVEGIEVVDRIAAVQKGAADRPVDDIRMTIKML